MTDLTNLSKKQKMTVLVVDDERFNRELLGNLLASNGYEVIKADSGDAALEMARKFNPDTIILDVIMPGKDGFEVCESIKSDKKLEGIPVLMVTALADRENRLKGIKAGASDFLYKPIDSSEILLKVRNSCHHKQLLDTAVENFKRLQELEFLRDNLTKMIVHDMRSPLFGILGDLQLLQMETLCPLPPQLKRVVDLAFKSTNSLVEMLNSLLDISRLETKLMPLEFTECDLRDLVDDAYKMLENAAKMENMEFKMNRPKKPVLVKCDKSIIKRVLLNLFSNALKHTAAGSMIELSIENITGNKIKILVRDNGPGVPQEHMKLIFEKFGVAELNRERRKTSVGLGLYFCKLAVEAHQGEIGAENISAPGKGCTFWFTLPLG